MLAKARVSSVLSQRPQVARIDDQSFGTYGVPRVTAELRLGLGRRVNHKRVARLRRERGLQGITAGAASPRE